MRRQQRQRADVKFPSVTVQRKGDKRIMKMSVKTWRAVHEGGDLFELYEPKAEKKG